MRGCMVRVNIVCLLEALGIDDARSISLLGVKTDKLDPDVVKLYLSSVCRNDMPEVESECEFPEAQICCTRIQSHFEYKTPTNLDYIAMRVKHDKDNE